jgi:uncharacterized protein (DUF697 family)
VGFLDLFKTVSPSNLRRLTNARLSDLVLSETVRAKKTLDNVTQRYPSAGPREIGQRLIDSKKSMASLVGGISGVFGIFSVPPDLIVMTYLQIQLLTEVATLYKVNLKSEHARGELIDVFGYANGIGPVQRASPKVLGGLAGMVLTRVGRTTLGRAVPLAAAPISAWLNNQHIQAVGEHAVRHYDGFDKAHEKTQKASGA